jgi:superfamily II DNA or RNA helicase
MARRLRIHRYWGGRRLSGIERADSVGWVVVASRQQLYARLTSPELDWLRPADVLVIDEAHHSTAPTYLDIKRWRGGLKGRPSFACIGLSATPFRSDVERSDHLARLFDRSLVAGSVMGDHWKDRVLWLQTHEYIARVERQDLGLGTVPLTPDEERDLVVSPNLDTGIDRLNRRLGDDEARSRLLIDVVAKMPQNWPVIIFAASVGHAKRLAMLFGEKNISARPVWATLAQWARRDAIEAFRAGDVRVLTNYDVLAEGFDAPSTRAIVIGRLVRSDGLFLQMLGRGMRGPKNGGTDQCLLVTTGERLPERFDQEGNLDVQRHEWLWTVR